MLFYCVTTLALGLIQPCSRLDYLPPRASLITSSADHPEKTKSKINVHVSRQESTVSTMSNQIPKLVTSTGEILVAYWDVFDGSGCFPGLPYHIHVDPSVTPKQTLANQSLFIWKSLSNRRLTRCYKQEFWSQLIRQCLGLIVLFLFKVKISLEISSWESVWILQIWTKKLCMSHTISRPLKILLIILQRLV